MIDDEDGRMRTTARERWIGSDVRARMVGLSARVDGRTIGWKEGRKERMGGRPRRRRGSRGTPRSRERMKWRGNETKRRLTRPRYYISILCKQARRSVIARSPFVKIRRRPRLPRVEKSSTRRCSASPRPGATAADASSVTSRGKPRRRRSRLTRRRSV